MLLMGDAREISPFRQNVLCHMAGQGLCQLGIEQTSALAVDRKISRHERRREGDF